MRLSLSLIVTLASLLARVLAFASPSGVAAERTPSFGVWLTVWWTSDDQHRHWANCHRMPIRGRYTSGDPTIVAAHFAEFRELGIDFLIMDDTNGVGADGGRINENIRAWLTSWILKRPQNGSHLHWRRGRNEGLRPRWPQQATDFYWATWAQRPSYLKLSGKPLLLEMRITANQV